MLLSNENTRDPLPLVDDITTSCTGATVFSDFGRRKSVLPHPVRQEE